MTEGRRSIDELIARYRELLDQDQLEIVEAVGGIASLEWFADSTTVPPDQRGEIALLVEQIRRHQRAKGR